MLSDDWRPEIIIGVDFGMTCTGQKLIARLEMLRL